MISRYACERCSKARRRRFKGLRSYLKEPRQIGSEVQSSAKQTTPSVRDGFPRHIKFEVFLAKCTSFLSNKLRAWLNSASLISDKRFAQRTTWLEQLRN